jgi:hypothetical protein
MVRHAAKTHPLWVAASHIQHCSQPCCGHHHQVNYASGDSRVCRLPSTRMSWDIYSSAYISQYHQAILIVPPSQCMGEQK